MGRVLSDDKRNPHRFDPSPSELSPAQSRGWRTREEASREPCRPMRKYEVEIERLGKQVAELEARHVRLLEFVKGCPNKGEIESWEADERKEPPTDGSPTDIK